MPGREGVAGAGPAAARQLARWLLE